MNNGLNKISGNNSLETNLLLEQYKTIIDLIEKTKENCTSIEEINKIFCKIKEIKKNIEKNSIATNEPNRNLISITSTNEISKDFCYPILKNYFSVSEYIKNAEAQIHQFFKNYTVSINEQAIQENVNKCLLSIDQALHEMGSTLKINREKEPLLSRKCLNEFAKIESITFYKKGLFKIPEPLKINENFPQLTELSLPNNNFHTFPDIVLKIKKLIKLDLSNNNLFEIPNSINQLKYLKSLNLTYNLLDEFPSPLLTMTGLQYIDLSDNSIKSVPTKISQLTQLQKLFLDNTLLNTLPIEICTLPKLETICVSGTIDPKNLIKVTTVSFPVFKYCLNSISNFFDFKALSIPSSNEIIPLEEIDYKEREIVTPLKESMIHTIATTGECISVGDESNKIYVPIIQDAEHLPECMTVPIKTISKRAFYKINNTKRAFKIIEFYKDNEINSDEMRASFIAGKIGVGPKYYGVGCFRNKIFIEMELLVKQSEIQTTYPKYKQLYKPDTPSKVLPLIKKLCEQKVSYGDDMKAEHIWKNVQENLCLIDYGHSNIHDTIEQAIKGSFCDQHMFELLLELKQSKNEDDIKLVKWFCENCPSLLKEIQLLGRNSLN